MSIAGSAIAALQKELRSPCAARKIIKPVKSPSPSRRAAAVEVRVTPETLPPPFRDVRYQSQFELLPSGAYAVSEEEFEDWEPQVGPTPPPSFHFPHFNPVWTFTCVPPLFTVTKQPITCCPHEDSSVFLSSPVDLHPSVLSAGFYLL